ncbi:MAG: DUF4238 domain-containing protein [Methylocella sp.]
MIISGYWANLLVCTPAWIRVSVDNHNRFVLANLRATEEIKSSHGKPDFKLKHSLAALEKGIVKIETEPDYMRAMNTKNLMKYAGMFYDSDWIVLRNETDTDFLTSDNPVAFHDQGPWRGGKPGLPRYLPVSRKFCLYCETGRNGRLDQEPDFRAPPKGHVRFATLSAASGVDRINDAVIQCAEDIVLSSQKTDSLGPLVDKYSSHKVCNEFIKMKLKDGFFFAMRTRVCDPNALT